ncbi:TfoX/Sxy family protein [Oscillibacter sp. MSJ-2]|uniref:TfoX/Sxy family protein n=1 Tax=Dysosmobacter acutus TaxID=2841504 RepID=A0ABS6FD01_9FIRM|nr:TfoX/Sxy family DNA transformation protein [Dysosmobacter acutus]MBU5627204.1 TfoX/Sxy family protein [Dysosmobacter acutus]
MELTDLPNIGPVLEGHLRSVGIISPESLRRCGAAEAFVRIRAQTDKTACLHKLLALEAAVEGIPKKELSAEKKAELKAFYKSLA